MNGWQPGGMGITSGQDADSYSVSFTHPAAPGSELTVTFYPVIYSGRPGVYTVERLDRWTAGTWRDVRYAEVPGVVPQASLEVASRLARSFAEDALRNPARIGWDGQPFQMAG